VLLHFTQSLELRQGAGLGQAALSLHLAMRKESGQCSGVSAESDPLHAPRPTPHAPSSMLLATRGEDFTREWPDVIQGVRKGPVKAFYAPELKRMAAEALAGADWFHGHGLYVWMNMWLGGEARRRGKPLVYHSHGFFDLWILQRSRGKKRIAHWLFEDANIKHVRWWRALSSKEADQIRAVVGSHAVVHVIPNGVDLDEVDGFQSSVLAVPGETFLADSAGSEEAEAGDRRSEVGFSGARYSSLATRHGAWTRRRRPKRLLFLSRIHPKKGLDLLVPVWGRLQEKFPDWELLVVGPDGGGYQRQVEAMIRSAGCGQTCRICPAVSGPEKHALMRTADLFVLPSYSEGFPMSVLEAAAHWIPVVQTTECNFPELARAGAAWECLPEAGGVETALGEALSTDDAERKERGARGRELVERQYTWSQLARQVEAACED
jgi:glycosyltransferase involved in cell wall biosynthesis